MNNAEKYRETTERERLEILSIKLEISSEHFIQECVGLEDRNEKT